MKPKSLIKILNYCWVVTFLSLAACEMVVDIDLPPHESKLVVNSLITPGSLVTVRVYKSLGPLDRQEAVEVTNAKVILLENGAEVETLEFVGGAFNYYQTKTFRPEALKTYTLKVQAPGFPDVESSCVIPGKVSIQQATVRDSAGIDEGGGYYSRLSVRFQDPGGEKNFYNLSGKQLYTYTTWPLDPNAPKSYNYFPIYFFSDLNDVEEAGENGMLLKDDLFNGRQYEVILNFYPMGSNQDSMVIAFKNASPEYYEYFRKLQPHMNNQGGDIFGGEPVVMPSNIKNGYGLFAGYSQDTLLVVN